MGLFSGIKKAFKKVFKGIKKVFKKVGNFVGKVLNSKLGKVLMIAAAVFTGGAALMAGIGNAAAAGGGFLTKFVAGAKGFISGLMSPMNTWKGAVGGAQGGGGLAGAMQGAATGSGALEAGALASQAPNPGAIIEGEAAVSAADAGLQAGASAPGRAGMENMFGSQAAEVAKGAGAVAKEPGMLAKAAGAVGDFAKSTGGGLLLTNAVQGLAQGKALEDQLKYGDYYDRKWADPRQSLILEEASGAARSGFLDRARRYESGRAGAVSAARPRIGYQRGERQYATGTSGGGG